MKLRACHAGLGVFLLLLMACIVLFSVAESEPEHLGKPLSFWIDQYDRFQYADNNLPEKEAAERALREIGTNAIPFLVNMVKRTETPLERFYEFLNSRLKFTIRYRPAWVQNRQGAAGICLLGSKAHGAIDSLFEIYESERSTYSSGAAVRAIAGIGTPGHEALARIIHRAPNQGMEVKRQIVSAISFEKPPFELVGDLLIAFLDEPDAMTKVLSIRTLGGYGEAAQSAIPKLQELLVDESFRWRADVQRSLSNISSNID